MCVCLCGYGNGSGGGDRKERFFEMVIIFQVEHTCNALNNIFAKAPFVHPFRCNAFTHFSFEFSSS